MTAPRAVVHFEVEKQDLRKTRFVTEPLPALPEGADLAPGEVLLAVDRFAFTANNVTYAVIGESFGYWQFFPASDARWGRIPVWGFGTAVLSRSDAVKTGERFYGYYPLASHLKVRPEAAPGGFVEITEHRRPLPAIYNRYERVEGPPDPRREGLRALFQPLFGTAFLLDDWLASKGFFGASRVLLTSASSKTAFSLAAVLARREKTARPRIVGLTSPKHRGFVEGLGVYDEVVLYDAIDSLPKEKTVSVDMAGSEKVLGAIHRRLAGDLAHSCRVGASHWESRPDPSLQGQEWPGPAPELFFAPTHAAKLAQDWGPQVFVQRIAASLSQFLSESRGGWLLVTEARGEAAVEAVYRRTLDGEVPPDAGNILSLLE
jgi:hypothetical protein